ncbi:1,4-alpha-glucan branching protein GlgB [Acetobacterium woodii]|uniref:1,4-alpha-glucan branching enzyme GlgB n=1 Tax=Acetobacterium woodii (strain ATCC 29683 / DSM 1030 / JCM 2381 / KCTC 1655 / WB1) TaxID=931626 RepID=H6LH14_ACEWD|nr:1,4-alpha-glucan branching protein GlgB [Acetobacterium woodii]AFA47152.1 1,4-alpha-glucan branching enzyme GlgB [Acetobacterium woodii DSM 1030]
MNKVDIHADLTTNKRYLSYHYFGAHRHEKGVTFRVWAPNAQNVAVVGDFNNWDINTHPMDLIPDNHGVWELDIPNLTSGLLYKYAVRQYDGKLAYKADPYGFYSEVKPKTASIIWDLNDYNWQDEAWCQKRNASNWLQKPINIYEVHLGSWKRNDQGNYLTYHELAEQLVPYLVEMHYTHIELMPIMEHPFDGSWGYQLTGYFAATSRYGQPQGLMYFIDCCHQAGIGVILDWVPGHFCKDDPGLRHFDGTNQYEFSEHQQWGTMVFDYGKPEVLDFLISNAHFWFDYYHIDGLRIDGVASMIELNHGLDGCPFRNVQGGTDRLEALAFFRELNTIIFRDFPYAIMSAEDSTSYPMVTWPVDKGGLGFNLKWDMGWMHDTLDYMKTDPFFRNRFHNLLTFSMAYAFNENFILPLSHDEVVHGKLSIVDKMFGDYNMKFDQFRLLFGYLMTHPGKKLSFMGNEFAPFLEWRENESLEWFLLDYEKHRQMQTFVKDLNKFYLKEKALWTFDHSWDGFQWLEPNNSEQSILIFKRMGPDDNDTLITVINFCPLNYTDYCIGVPRDGNYRLAFNSDDPVYGGTGFKMKKSMKAQATPLHGQDYSVSINLPPSSMIVLKGVVPRSSTKIKTKPTKKTKPKK